MRIGIIGGGAAGFMAAISAKVSDPACEVTILEKTGKLLSKVKVSGGGRCNVTNAIESLSEFARSYPRGEKLLKKALSQFSSRDTIQFFESRGVKLKAEADGRMFPVSNSSQSVIDCLLREAQTFKVEIKKNCPVQEIRKGVKGFELHCRNEVSFFDRILIASGGSPQLSGFNWLAGMGHHIVAPVPSLFTFNMPSEAVRSLQGVVAGDARIRIINTKLSSKGPLLITHWGMSGPAVLKLSAWGARILADLNYGFKVAISWIDKPEEQIRSILTDMSLQQPKKKVLNTNPFGLPQRLWAFLFGKTSVSDKTCGECGKKDFNKLTEVLINDVYNVEGKTTFKEEFVTSGGVDLSEVDFNTMESRICPGLYFAGEVLDMDGITGGFNFQAAWTTGFIAGQNMVIS